MSAPTDPALYTFQVTVCRPCLKGDEGECHSPGCTFWVCPAPTAEQADRLRANLPSYLAATVVAQTECAVPPLAQNARPS